MDKFLFLFPLEFGAYTAAFLTILTNSLILFLNTSLFGLTYAGNVYYNICSVLTGFLLFIGIKRVNRRKFLSKIQINFSSLFQQSSSKIIPWIFFYTAGCFEVFVTQIKQQNYLVLLTSLVDVYLLFVVICLYKKFLRWKIKSDGIYEKLSKSSRS